MQSLEAPSSGPPSIWIIIWVVWIKYTYLLEIILDWGKDRKRKSSHSEKGPPAPGAQGASKLWVDSTSVGPQGRHHTPPPTRIFSCTSNSDSSNRKWSSTSFWTLHSLRMHTAPFRIWCRICCLKSETLCPSRSSWADGENKTGCEHSRASSSSRGARSGDLSGISSVLIPLAGWLSLFLHPQGSKSIALSTSWFLSQWTSQLFCSAFSSLPQSSWR